MGWIARFFLMVVFLSVTELYLLIWASERTSILFTLALCVLTGIVGGALVRSQGLQTLRAIRGSLGRGQMPAQTIVSGLILLIIGTLFLTPGFLTDAIGFLMLIPGVRHIAASRLVAYFKTRIKVAPVVSFGGSGRSPSSESTVIDVEAEVVDSRRPGEF